MELVSRLLIVCVSLSIVFVLIVSPLSALAQVYDSSATFANSEISHFDNASKVLEENQDKNPEEVYIAPMIFGIKPPQCYVLKPIINKTLPGVIKTTFSANGAIGCSAEAAAFEVACNAALDAETVGYGAVMCAAVGGPLVYECEQHGAKWIVDHRSSFKKAALKAAGC